VLHVFEDNQYDTSTSLSEGSSSGSGSGSGNNSHFSCYQKIYAQEKSKNPRSQEALR